MEEMLDIYTRDGIYLGTKEKSICHGKNPGFYHKPVWVWIINSQKQILVQKKAACKKNQPNKWDMSSAGHVKAGETTVEGAIRETYEELGIKTKEENYKFLFEYIYEPGHEIAQVLLASIDTNEFKLKEDEVSEVKWLNYEEFEELLFSNEFAEHDMEYRNLIKNKIKKEELENIEEIFDIYTRDGIYLGTKEKSICHGKTPGFYHKPVWIWTINSKNQSLFQKRAACKKNYPNKWATCSGHVLAGETIVEGAIRETYEELGIKTKEEDYKFICELIVDKTFELAQIYLLKIDTKINEFKIQEEELSEVKWIDNSEVEKMMRSDDFLKFNDETDEKYIKIILNILKEQS